MIASKTLAKYSKENKYPLGVQELNVPRASTGLEAKQQAMRGAAMAGATGGKIGGTAGKAIGSIFGPVGGAIGEIAGNLLGSATGAIIGGQAGKKKGEIMANTKDSMHATAEMDNAAIFNQNMNYSGNESEQLRSLGGEGMQMAEHGMEVKELKPIEVEKDELMFQKIFGKYRMVADMKGKPTHEEGGVPVLAKEGTIIFPGNRRSSILDLVDKRSGLVTDPSRFEAQKSKLPIDK